MNKVTLLCTCVLVAALAVVLPIQHFAALGGEAPYPASSLAGKWNGTPPDGGELELNLQVTGNKITGSGLIAAGKGRDIEPDVSGEIDGKIIFIQTYFPTAQRTVRYRCTWAGQDVLQCRAGRFKTELKRRQN